MGNPPVRGRDRIAVLIEQFCSVDRRTTTELQLCQAVHDAVFGLCLAMLESQEAAREAEQETWRKFLIHLSRSNDVSEIHNGTAYVRSIGRNVCAARLMARTVPWSGPGGGLEAGPISPGPVLPGPVSPGWATIVQVPLNGPVNGVAKGARRRHLRLRDARHARRAARRGLPWRRRSLPLLALVLAVSWPAAASAAAS